MKAYRRPDGASDAYTHFIITSPMASYFKSGAAPIIVYVSETYRRAVKGGVGEAKTGGNYATSLFVSEDAERKGYSQVLWLDAVVGRYLEEVGAMNVFFVYSGGKIVTPALSGSILPGIKRKAMIELASRLGLTIEEKRLDNDEIIEEVKSGAMTEVFGCGTAAVVSPIGTLGYRGAHIIVNDNKAGLIAARLRDEFTDIQFGIKNDPFGWIHAI